MASYVKIVQACSNIDLTVDSIADISDGTFYPWWLWLANAGHVHEFVEDGVISFKVVVIAGCMYFDIQTRTRTWRVRAFLRSSKQKLVYWTV